MEYIKSQVQDETPVSPALRPFLSHPLLAELIRQLQPDLLQNESKVKAAVEEISRYLANANESMNDNLKKLLNEDLVIALEGLRSLLQSQGDMDSVTQWLEESERESGRFLEQKLGKSCGRSSAQDFDKTFGKPDC